MLHSNSIIDVGDDNIEFDEEATTRRIQESKVELMHGRNETVHFIPIISFVAHLNIGNINMVSLE